MLTYDNTAYQDGNELAKLVERNLPDIIECGENNKVWIRVSRKKREMSLIDKVTGKTTAKVSVDDHFERIAASYGVGPRQLGAVRDALKL